MKWIGLTGGIACGKTSVAHILRSEGLVVIDADALAHQALSPGEIGHQKVVTLFGSHILNENGSINRKTLGSIVFNNKEDLAKLENIIHPWVQEHVKSLRQDLQNKNVPMAFYDVPLLFEKKLQHQFQATIVVACDEIIQLQRLQLRNGFSKEDALLRIRAQIPLSEKIAQASFVIWNNGDLKELHQSVLRVLLDLKNHK